MTRSQATKIVEAAGLDPSQLQGPVEVTARGRHRAEVWRAIHWLRGHPPRSRKKSTHSER